MTLHQLIRTIADENGLTQAQADGIVRRVFECIGEGLVYSESVNLGGFGSFRLRVREARVYRNPRTGGPVKVPRKRAVTFTPGKQLKDQVAAMPPP